MYATINYAARVISLLAIVTACQLHPASSSTADAIPTSGADTLVTMTYNIHHANPPGTAEGTIRIDSIAAVINGVQPDLVALQEIDVHTERSGPALHEAARLAALTGMHYYFTQTLDYEGGAYGIAVLSRLPVIDSVGYLLPREPGTREEPRAVCMLQVRLADSSTLYFASTHLGLTRKSRDLQTDSILQIFKKHPGALIIGGDFNARPSSAPIAKLLTVLSRSCTADCAPTIPSDKPREKIDYLMYKGNLQPLEQRVLNGTPWSDHLPVVTTFVLQPEQ